MAQIRFRYLSETKYNSLPEEEKLLKDTFYMVKDNDKCSVFNNDIKYASNTDIKIIDTESSLPEVGQNNYAYITKDGSIYVWDIESKNYIVVMSSNFDIINGGDANSKKDITM